MEVAELTALELGGMIQRRQVSCREAVESALDMLTVREPEVNAYICVTGEQALEQAAHVQMRLDAGEALSPLAGVPMALKDNICTEGVATTCASRMLEGYIPPYQATVVQKLYAGGGVMLGKLNQDELSMGGTTETSAFGSTRNPWDPARVPGGSSGGSAAAVAAGEAFYTLGSDTGGSIRQPCSFCGVTGIKPTYGAVSRYGLVAMASSMDQIGPIGRDIRDCVAVLSLIQGKDPRDPVSRELPGGLHNAHFERNSLDSIVIGLPEEFWKDEWEADIRKSMLEAARLLESLGARLIGLPLPAARHAGLVYQLLCAEEASSNLARYSGALYGFRSKNSAYLDELFTHSRAESLGWWVKRRIMLGSLLLGRNGMEKYDEKIQRLRNEITAGFTSVFAQCDMLLWPVSPITACFLGEGCKNTGLERGDSYTAAVNLAGLPAVALPCGFDGQGLPIGMQLVGRAFEDYRLAAVAAIFQQNTDHHLQRPPVWLVGKDGIG